MEEQIGLISMKGNPLTLMGKQPKIGEKAPDFELLDNELSKVTLASLRGRICVLISVPSLDTPVCDIETRRFNEEAVNLGSDVSVIAISMDLPFAQKRWCGAAGVEKVMTLSDHFDGSYGESYGILIKELRLLARAIFVVDRDGVIQYTQLVKEITDEPDYEAIIEAVKKLD